MTQKNEESQETKITLTSDTHPPTKPSKKEKQRRGGASAPARRPGAPAAEAGAEAAGRGQRRPATGKLYSARSRLYRSQSLQVNMHLKALAEIYTMHSFALCDCYKITVFLLQF